MAGQNPLQRLEQDINEVEGQIKQAETNAETATSEKDRDYWRQKESQLRQKDSQLRQKELQSQGQATRDPFNLILAKISTAQSHLPLYQQIDPIADVINTALDIFGVALWAGTDDHTLELYLKAANLPGQDTRLELRNKLNLILDAPYYHQPAKSSLIVCLKPGTRPALLKLTGDDQKTKDEYGIHAMCHKIPGVVGEVELVDFGRGSRITITKVDADDAPCQTKAGFGILMPMMCASLDQFTQPLSEADVLRGAPAIKKALEEVHKKHIWHNDVKPGNIFIDYEEGAWHVGDFGSSTWQTQPTERTQSMWPPGEPASSSTDFVLLANTVLCVLHLRSWRDPADRAFLHKTAERIRTRALRAFVQELL